MKIAKGHYVPKELITSEAVHEAVARAFVAAGFETKSHFGKYDNPHDDGLCVSMLTGNIIWGAVGETCDTHLTLQQLFTADNGLQWPDFATEIRTDDNAVWFFGGGQAEHICGHVRPISHRVLATRQPKEKEVKNETLGKSVIHFNGVWPDGGHTHIIYRPEQTGIHAPFWISSNPEWHKDCISFSRQEFEAAAKRLGYINGYRWGVEYPTNGERPDLSDDVTIELKPDWSRTFLSPTAVHGCNWIRTAFKIVDQRYKPADTSYLNVQPQDQSLTHSEEGLTHSWHGRGELPPVGVECEYSTGHVWHSCYIKCHVESDGVNVAIFQGKNHWGGCVADRFRPIRTDREKFIEEATAAAIIGDDKSVKLNPCITAAFERLFAAGFRVPKVEK